MQKPTSPLFRFAVIAKLLVASIVVSVLSACTESAPVKNNAAASPSTASAAPAATPAAANSLPDPCQLLTKAEAEAILGEPVREPEAGGLGGNKTCDYKTVKIHGGVLPYSVHIAIIGESQKVWDAGKQLHQQSDAKGMKPVSGVGDDAYYLLDDLDIFSKDRYIAINVMKDIDKPNHEKSIHDAELAVAQKAIPRLP